MKLVHWPLMGGLWWTVTFGTSRMGTGRGPSLLYQM